MVIGILTISARFSSGERAEVSTQLSLVKWASRSLLAILIIALSLGGVSPVRAAPPSVTVPILMYHHIGLTSLGMPEAQYYVPVTAFEAQMAYLAQQGFSPVSIDQIANALQVGMSLPPRPVALTFDDADQDNFDNAFPVLLKYHLFATFFIVTGWVGTPGHLTWDEIALMQKAGMLFGAHTLTHPYLTQLSAAAAQAEIVASKSELEARLGQAVTVFAYPYGRAFPAITRMVEAAGFVAALGTSPARLTQTSAELFYLTRFGVYRWTTFERFTGWLATAAAQTDSGMPRPQPGGHCAPGYSHDF